MKKLFFLLLITVVSCNSKDDNSQYNYHLFAAYIDEVMGKDTTRIGQHIEEFFKETFTENMSNEMLLKRSFHLISRECYFHAIQGFDYILEIDELNAKALLGRGVCISRMGHKEKGYSIISKAIELEPNNSKSYFWRSLLGLDKDEAYEDICRAISLDSNNAYYYLYRAFYFKEKTDVEKDLTKSIDLEPDWVDDPICLRSMYYADIGEIEKALDDHNNLIKLYPRKYYFGKLLYLKSLGKIDEAIKAGETAIKNGYATTSSLKLIGEIYFDMCLYEKSIKSYHLAWANAGKIDKKYPTLYYYPIVENYAKIGDEDSLYKYIAIVISQDDGYIDDIKRDSIYIKYLQKERFKELLKK